MELARYVVEAVVLEGRSYREVARAHGVSKSWVAKVVGRYRAGGDEAIEPRSRAPKHIPHRTPAELEDEIVRLRKELCEQGFDAGAETIRHHLVQQRGDAPSVPTIWRVLRRRGFVVPSPTSGPGPPGSASRPSSPTSAGSPTSPTGSFKTAPRWRSSTSSTTTPGSRWALGCSPWPRRWEPWRCFGKLAHAGGFLRRSSPTTGACTPRGTGEGPT